MRATDIGCRKCKKKIPEILVGIHEMLHLHFCHAESLFCIFLNTFVLRTILFVIIYVHTKQ